MSTQPIKDAELEALFSGMARYTRWGLAVSGGADSTALMHLAVRWAGMRGAAAPQLTVVTVDHCLRPESASETRRVASMASALGLPHATLKWLGPKPRSAVQAAAREARYDLMTAHAHTAGLSCLVTAHHLDDQAETLLMRLRRGSGIDGLTGVPALSRWAGIPVWRPFLGMPASRLRATLRAWKIKWIEDPSNADHRFERVRVREAMSQMAAIGLTAEGLAASARRLQRARQALDATTRAFLSEHAETSEFGYGEIELASLRSAPEEIALRALSLMLETVRGLPAPYSLAGLERLTGQLRAGRGKALTLGGCRFILQNGSLMVVREPGRTGLEELVLEPGKAAVWDHRFHVSAPDCAAEPVTVRALGPQGFSRVRARLRRRLAVPATAAASIVSIWRGEELIAVPPLAFAASDDRDGAGYSARFVNAAEPFTNPLH